MKTETPNQPGSLDPQPPAPATNAFTEAFLRELGRDGESHTAAEAELAGPWDVRPAAGGFAVLREGQPGGAGREGLFDTREHALAAAAVLPAIHREPLLRLAEQKSPQGYNVMSIWGDAWVRAVGRLRQFEPEVVDSMNLVETLLRAPASLAFLLEAAGERTLELAGEIVVRRLARRRFEEGDGVGWHRS